MNLVISGNKREYKVVDTISKKEYFCVPRKTLLLKKGPIIIGDNVVLDSNNIVDILPRKNTLIRPRIANIDIGIIVVSLVKPDFSSYLLDKFLTYLNYCNINVYIVFTKYDLLDDKQKEKMDKVISYYQNNGYFTFKTNKYDSSSYNDLKEKLKRKIVAFMGQTGVGKSTLINMIDSTFKRQEGTDSFDLGRGRHQTKEVILLPFDEGYIGDTPGFSALDLKMIGLNEKDIKNYFPILNKYIGECYFKDCMHMQEKNCKIKELVSNNIISNETYNNYVKIILEMKENR